MHPSAGSSAAPAANTAAIDPLTIRCATIADGPALWRLAGRCDGLEQNTLYAYVLLCSHFRETTLVAQRAGEVVGFVAAYRPPTTPDCVFVWQVAVAANGRGQGLATRLIRSLLATPVCADARWLTATVALGNTASQRLFSGIAHRLNVACSVERGFDAEHFGAGAHEVEQLFRIGPLTSIEVIGTATTKENP